MSYKNEFGEKYAIPPELATLQEEFPKLEDVSWHNDAMPHLEIDLGDDVKANIWWDTESQEDGEFADMKNEEWRRFALSINDNCIRWTNDIREITDAFHLLAKLFQL